MSDSMAKVLEYLGEDAKARPAPFVLAQPRKRPAKAARAPVKKGRVALQPYSHTADPKGNIVVRAPQLTSRAIVRLAEKLAVRQETVLIVSDIALRTFHRRQEKHEALTATESDRVLRIARVAKEAERVFGSSEKSTRWLSSENRVLDAKPLDLLATDAGARDVEAELIRIDYGDFA